LSGPLAAGRCGEGDLARVQRRREWPTRTTQWMQLIAQNTFLKKTLEGRALKGLPFALKLLRWFPMLQRIPARVVGIGIRPEPIDERRKRKHA
jgi:hypothetical protein